MKMAEDYEDSDFSLSWTDHLQVLQRVITALRYKVFWINYTVSCIGTKGEGGIEIVSEYPPFQSNDYFQGSLIDIFPQKRTVTIKR